MLCYSQSTIAADDVRPLFAARVPDTWGSCDPRVIAGIAARLLRCPTSTVTCVSPADPVFRRASGRGDVALAVKSFAHAIILKGRREIVCDATADPRFERLLQVILFPKVRFLAGFPLRGATGEILGALTLMDYEVRPHPDAAVVREVECLSNVIATALMPVQGTA